MFRIKAWCLFFKSPSVPNRSVCCIEWKKVRSSRCCAVFGHFLYCFTSFDSREFKFSATSDRKGPGCVAEFCAMGCLANIACLSNSTHSFLVLSKDPTNLLLSCLCQRKHQYHFANTILSTNHQVPQYHALIILQIFLLIFTREQVVAVRPLWSLGILMLVP